MKILKKKQKTNSLIDTLDLAAMIELLSINGVCVRITLDSAFWKHFCP